MPSFAVDDGFAYAVPDDLSGVAVGSMVRVPLGGRRVRGFVTALRDGEPERALKPIKARSGEVPVFDQHLLETARWVSTHYVAPLSVVLGRCAPPNLPNAVSDIGDAADRTARTRPRYLISGQPPLLDSTIEPAIAGGSNALYAAPTAREAIGRAHALAGRFPERVRLVTSETPAAERTDIWSQAAARSGIVVVGTREIAFWGAGTVGVAVIEDEARRAYKAKQTPTYHLREVWRRRSAVERFGLVYTGPVPTTDVVAAGTEIDPSSRRVWPLVDIADRREDPGSLVSDHTRVAIGAVLKRGGTVFVLANRRGYAAAFRCVRCGEIRRCTNCGSGLERTDTCPRCGTENTGCARCGGRRFEPLGAGIGRVVDDLLRRFPGVVGPIGEGRAVTVGTERDLVELDPVDLAVAVDADGMILAPHYRAGEHALHVLVRLALATTPGRGRKAIVQTFLPEHAVMDALRAGRPMPFVAGELATRAAEGLPPVGALIALETDAAVEEADPLLHSAGSGATVLGPAPTGNGHRWLFQGEDLTQVRIRLRSTVQGLRDGGARVRVDADPVDL